MHQPQKGIERVNDRDMDIGRCRPVSKRQNRELLSMKNRSAYRYMDHKENRSSAAKSTENPKTALAFL